jgi:hypothetical protein
VGGSQPGQPQVKLPEFTADKQKSVNWARRGGWLCVKIRAKYLTRGDTGQKCWVCKKKAPLIEARFIPYSFILMKNMAILSCNYFSYSYTIHPTQNT